MVYVSLCVCVVEQSADVAFGFDLYVATELPIFPLQLNYPELSRLLVFALQRDELMRSKRLSECPGATIRQASISSTNGEL
jgi:hypothetical protein